MGSVYTVVYDYPFVPSIISNSFPDQLQIRHLVLRLHSLQSVVWKDAISTYYSAMGQSCCHYEPRSRYRLFQHTKRLPTSANQSCAAVLDV
jgi:hypothetical protein